MVPGLRVGERFEIEREAGAGGIGTVYRALDRETGAPVAIKLLRDGNAADVERFARETRLLAEIQHPGVVRYVANGTTEAGTPYLVMEWLEGEDLHQRLERAGLTQAESVGLIERVCEALSGVHACAVVHRDIKPSNLFLCGGRVDDVKVIDFGIARLGYATHVVTRSGTGVGTPGYMAPEQARGSQKVDARADVFSLGCVLFKCLTSHAAFAGKHVMAVLAKVLLEEAPRVSEFCPSVPDALDALVARMLSKQPADRPADAAAVLTELRALGPMDGELRASRAPITLRPTGLTEGEQRVVSVLLVGANHVELNEGRGPDSTSDRLEDVLASMAATVVLHVSSTDRAMRTVVAEHNGHFDRLADGTRVVTLASVGVATDQAARAARCALALRSAVPDRPVALATGRGKVGGRWPVGEVIDRAARVLRTAQHIQAAGGARSGPAVQIDELTVRLLDARFELDGLMLLGERESAEDARTLLGKQTSCVGRDRELRALEELFEECASESVARAVLVTAAAGVGKSRLHQELLRRLRARGEPLEVWVARGDPMRAGASFGMAGQMIRRAARLVDGEPLEARHQKLTTRVARHVAAPIQARVAEFLGEMAGTPFPDHDSVQLRAARQDPMLMGDQMRRAWVDLVEAECRAQPLLLVLEDLHWGDPPTVEYVDTALRLLRDQPLMVLVLARPEVHELFPKLWTGRGVTEMALGELSRKAREKLAREVLGDEVSAATVARIVERSAGNAFFLEELLRAEAEGRGDDVPDTVLAMVQSRLAGLEPLERRVLRAGSVFGQVFWRGGVAALLGGGTRALLLDEWLQRLEQREWITQRSEASFQGEREYVFRHAMVREAAYAMLTDEDRTLGHRLAGDWLEQVGEPDVMVLAEHFDRGGIPARAVGCYHRAAELALEGNDLAAAIARTTRAEAIGASGEVLGHLLLIRAEAHGWRGDQADAERWALDAMAALPAGGASWYVAVREVAKAASKLGHNNRIEALTEALTKERPNDAASGPETATIARLVVSLSYSGAFDRAKVLHERLDAAAERCSDDPTLLASIFAARAVSALYAGDAGGYRELSEAAQVRFEHAGDVRAACVERAHMGYACNKLGAYEEGAAILRVAITDAERMGLRNVAAMAKHNLGFALARHGALDEARAVQSEAILTFAAQGDRHLEGGARCYLAAILRVAGDLEGAEAEARRAIEVLAVVPPLEPFALATLADALLAGGRVSEARVAAEKAAALLESVGNVEEGEALVHLLRAETLETSGDHAAARAAIAAGRACLLERAAKIADPGWRTSFLARVPEHARILTLARAWAGGLSEPPSPTAEPS
jgi:tetratricopeptide (TPR) repeat protein